MDSFRTELIPEKADSGISHQDRLICVGSCFAENIGDRLNQLKFPVLINPFGIVYNPISVAYALEKILDEKKFTEKDFFENLGLYHSFSHHGRFSHPDKTTALNKINNALHDAHIFLKSTNRLILTLGTAHVFIYKKTNRVVANCHKIPGQEFLRKRLSVEEVAAPLISVLKRIKEKLPSHRNHRNRQPCKASSGWLGGKPKKQSHSVIGIGGSEKSIAVCTLFSFLRNCFGRSAGLPFL